MEGTSQIKKITAANVFAWLFVIVAMAAVLYMWGGNRSSDTIGGQKDEHGCLIAAGYSWCSARQKCERSWEKYCTTAEPKEVLFSCNDGKIITATFYPSDDQYVDLILSDSRELSLPRAISASGARYAKNDESFVFWNKGDTAFVTENGTNTFDGCVIKE